VMYLHPAVLFFQGLKNYSIMSLGHNSVSGTGAAANINALS